MVNSNQSFFSNYRYYLIIILLGILVFIPTLWNGFVWDDEEQVVNNSAVHSLANLPKLFAGSTFNTGGSGGNLSGMYYKPMMSVGFTGLWAIFGSRPAWFHLLQIVVHISSTILLFLIFKKLLSSINKLAEYIALVLALVFLIHPLNVETVVYISALQDALFMLFGLGAFYLVINQKNKNQLEYLWIGFLLLLSLLSKETGALFIPLILAYQLLIEKKKDKLLAYVNLSFILVVVYSILRFGIAGVYGTKEGLSPIMRVELLARIQTIPKVIAYYLQNIIWPQNLAIAQHWVVRQISLNQFWLPLILIMAFVSLIIIWGLKIRKTDKASFNLYLFFSIWFLLGLGLHLHLFPLDMTVADRWFYFPFVGLLGLLGVSLAQIKWSQKLTYYGTGVGVFLLIILSVRSVMRILNWRDGLTLFSHDIVISQNAFDLENNLGVELFRADLYDEAKPHFEKSIELAPYWWSNYNNLGAYYNRRGELEKAQQLYEKAIQNSDYYLAYINLAGVLLRQEKYGEARSFLETQALPRFPYNPKLQQMWQYLEIKEQEIENEEK